MDAAVEAREDAGDAPTLSIDGASPLDSRSEADGAHEADGASEADGNIGLDAPVGPDARVEPDAARDCGGCDDSVACTRDACVEGSCVHTPVHADCTGGQYCDVAAGCRIGTVCVTTTDCSRPDACAVPRCDSSTRTCRYSTLDGDADGHTPLACGGDDCDDARARVLPGGFEECNGLDDDCDGVVDDAEPDMPLYCEAGLTCVGGDCGCAPPTTLCGSFPGVCRDLQNDRYNCGACNIQCASGASCVLGRCLCPGASESCIGYDAVCTGSDCGCRAVSGVELCTVDDGLECARLDSNRRHCGRCNYSCGSRVCSSSRCW